MHLIRGDGRRQLLNHFQRDHFTGDFGEALRASLNLYKALFIKTDNITGVVPAGFNLAVDVFSRRHLKHAWVFHAQITVHHVWPFQLQTATVLNARHGQQTRIHPRQNSTHRTRLRRHRYVNRDHGSTLGNAIAFENAQAKLVLPDLTRALLQFFRTGHHIPHAIEVIRIGETRIVAEEG